ncbi:MAG: hypothetical protein RLZZ352_8 [Pseudomonadota bacterium]
MTSSLVFSDTTRIREDAPVSKPGISTKLGGFAAPQPRPLPVIVLADVSGSMAENQKIQALNEALKSMLESFAKESRLRAEIQVGLITFGIDGAQEHLPLVAANRIESVATLQASGPTPMGKAFTLVRQWLEDKQRVASRAYRPVLVLVSDGAPTDDWEEPLQALKSSERAQKATRFAMAIGADADTQMLAQFANDREAPVFEADGARDIVRFFRAVTMSVVSRTSSSTPDQVQGLRLEADDLSDDLDLDDL